MNISDMISHGYENLKANVRNLSPSWILVGLAGAVGGAAGFVFANELNRDSAEWAKGGAFIAAFTTKVSIDVLVGFDRAIRQVGNGAAEILYGISDVLANREQIEGALDHEFEELPADEPPGPAEGEADIELPAHEPAAPGAEFDEFLGFADEEGAEGVPPAA